MKFVHRSRSTGTDINTHLLLHFNTMASYPSSDKNIKFDSPSEKIEKIDTISDEHQNQLAELSGIEATAASKAAWLISITVSLGGLLFGYDTGYISSVLVTIGTSLGHVLSSSEQELVTSLTSGGALVGAVGAGLTADRFGRRMPICTILQTAAYSVAQFAVGRFVVGLGVGSAAMVVPLYSAHSPILLIEHLC